MTVTVTVTAGLSLTSSSGMGPAVRVEAGNPRRLSPVIDNDDASQFVEGAVATSTMRPGIRRTPSRDSSLELPPHLAYRNMKTL